MLIYKRRTMHEILNRHRRKRLDGMCHRQQQWPNRRVTIAVRRQYLHISTTRHSYRTRCNTYLGVQKTKVTSEPMVAVWIGTVHWHFDCRSSIRCYQCHQQWWQVIRRWDQKKVHPKTFIAVHVRYADISDDHAHIPAWQERLPGKNKRNRADNPISTSLLLPPPKQAPLLIL